MAPSGGQEAGGQEVPLPAGWAAACRCLCALSYKSFILSRPFTPASARMVSPPSIRVILTQGYRLFNVPSLFTPKFSA